MEYTGSSIKIEDLSGSENIAQDFKSLTFLKLWIFMLGLKFATYFYFFTCVVFALFIFLFVAFLCQSHICPVRTLKQLPSAFHRLEFTQHVSVSAADEQC